MAAETSEGELKLGEEIGDGTTAQVFRGEWNGREIAVKRIKTDLRLMSERARLNLERELEILQSVKHPRLVEFIGLREEAGRVDIMMEYCHGGTAFDLLHVSDLLLLPQQKLKFAQDVGSAMEYLHSFNPPVIHRDLKSLNLLLQQPLRLCGDIPVVKVTDFGLARMMDDATGGQIIMTKNAGTYHWMAPEVFMSESYDCKVDVYSYGILLYEIICQEIPFADVQPARLGLMVYQGHRPDVADIPEDCPEFFSDLMKKCWSHEPDDRPHFTEINQILSGGAN